MSKYAKRVDANHSEIEAAFRQLLGDHVTNCAAFGDGFPDLFVSFGGQSGPAYACGVEIKRDDKATFTAHQIRFRNTHPGVVHRIETVEQAVKLAQQIRRIVTHLAALSSPHN